jgi:transposase
MATSQGYGRPTARRYSPEEKVAAVRTLRAELGTEHGTVQRVASQFESVRIWVKQADVDDRHVAGVTTTEARRVRDEARPPTPEVVAFIGANKCNVVEGRPIGVEPICSLLQVAPITYYATEDRIPSARTASDAVVTPELVSLWEANYRVYGVRNL